MNLRGKASYHSLAWNKPRDQTQYGASYDSLDG